MTSNVGHFYVYNRKGGKPVTTHQDYDCAKGRAWQLANENPGQTFMILEVKEELIVQEDQE